VLVRIGGIFEGPVYRIHGVPMRARKNYFSSVDSEKNDPVQILAQGSGVFIRVVSEPLYVYRLQAEGGRVDKGNTLIHTISVVS
jgi:hypothetical protein